MEGGRIQRRQTEREKKNQTGKRQLFKVCLRPQHSTAADQGPIEIRLYSTALRSEQLCNMPIPHVTLVQSPSNSSQETVSFMEKRGGWYWKRALGHWVCWVSMQAPLMLMQCGALVSVSVRGGHGSDSHEGRDWAYQRSPGVSVEPVFIYST